MENRIVTGEESILPYYVSLKGQMRQVETIMFDVAKDLVSNSINRLAALSTEVYRCNGKYGVTLKSFI